MDDIRINKFLIKTNTIKSIFSFFYIFNKQICENIIKKYSKKEYNDFQIKENNDLVLVSKNESCSDKILQDILENIKRIKIDGNDHNINVQNHTNFSGNFTKDIYKEITSSSKKVKNNQIRNLEVISNKNLNRNYFKNLNYFQEKKKSIRD
ncbi:MAG: hypothetical protein CfP315_0716 [Candidatus Improbicoccus pseudotrichonymphae]|uniref:Uncharacterized protein n=1 Tax=Candidatus Improbicoccus pseudotrichonymphae TaxID=3033792 RepID=A0AA48KZB5_9FIRM|nr:MAG: hypothetical protein CfP315_0716 [Candidatus Improbicoccus pseudotrichonymphae]